MERLIKTEEDYEKALAIIDELMDKKGEERDSERLEYWVTLVGIYEDERYPIAKPTPLSAIAFAMERQGLTRRDLEAFFGNKSKVSEVLSGKRHLTLEMIRRLHSGLGIPLDTLMQETPRPEQGVELDRLPFREMVERGWVRAVSGTRETQEEIRRWLDKIGIVTAVPAFCARSSSWLGARGDVYGTLAWLGGILSAAAMPLLSPFNPDALDSDFFHGLFALSKDRQGPLRARDYLASFGVRLVVLRHFRKTYLDGAALFAPDGRAVVGMSLRHDRVDNFWFTLAHELAHLKLGHIEPGCFVVDNLDMRSDDHVERAANTLAMDMMIPAEVWNGTSPAERSKPGFVRGLALKLGISPAIVAGRVRKETGNYKLFSRLVGNGEVRRLFPEWSQ